MGETASAVAHGPMYKRTCSFFFRGDSCSRYGWRGGGRALSSAWRRHVFRGALECHGRVPSVICPDSQTARLVDLVTNTFGATVGALIGWPGIRAGLAGCVDSAPPVDQRATAADMRLVDLRRSALRGSLAVSISSRRLRDLKVGRCDLLSSFRSSCRKLVRSGLRNL